MAATVQEPVAPARQHQGIEEMGIEDLRLSLALAQEKIMLQQDQIAKLVTQPWIYAVVWRCRNEVDPSVFKPNDLVIVIDENLPHHGRIARLGSVPDKAGKVTVLMPDLESFSANVGLGAHKAQVKLLGKDDGTHVTLFCNEHGTVEVHNLEGHKYQVGELVKVHPDSKRIMERCGLCGPGDVALVKQVVDDSSVEVMHQGLDKVVINLIQGDDRNKIEVCDRLQLDRTNQIALRRLGRELNTSFLLQEELNVEWSDIGGCRLAKEILGEALELPFLCQDYYQYYRQKLPKGFILGGPPGNGKTMLAKASATSLARRFGKDFLNTGLLYLKGADVLSCYVSVAEHTISSLFARAKRHYQIYKFPCFIVIEEADALLPKRGTRRSSDVEKTTVPAFLAEMDGLEQSHAVVFLLTNRPETIDPGVMRPGRIDRHIRVNRPDHTDALEIAQIHLRDIPVHKVKREVLATQLVSSLYSDQWPMYKVVEQNGHGQKKHALSLGNCASGAMIAGIVNQAAMIALKRDQEATKKTGVTPDDVHAAIYRFYTGYIDKDHEEELRDFCQERGIQPEATKVYKNNAPVTWEV